MKDIHEDTLRFATEAFGSPPSVKNIWIGDERSVSSTHADPYENLYTVVTGIKIFHLRPPCDAALLQKPSLQNARWKASTDKTHTECFECCVQPVEKYKGWSLVKESGETAWIDEKSCQVEYDNYLEVHLHAGDILYLPALWCKLVLLSFQKPKPGMAFNQLTFPFALFVPLFCDNFFLCEAIDHRVAQQGITIAINWWYEMSFGRDWVYRELCSNLRTVMNAQNHSSNGTDDDVN